MAITKFDLKPITTESDYSNITIGNSKFTDDEWDVSHFMTTKGVKRCRSKISFKYINNEEMKFVIKQYAYFCLGKLKASTVVNHINSKFPSFIQYCNINNIKSFKNVDMEILMNYVGWLRNEKKFSERTGYSKTLVVKELIEVGVSQGWNYFNIENNDVKVQRDLYSSYLIKNVMNDLETIDNKLCIKDFDKFLEFHNNEILRLVGNKNISSMGI